MKAMVVATIAAALLGPRRVSRKTEWDRAWGRAGGRAWGQAWDPEAAWG